MPQEPKKKHSKARKRTRRAAIKLASFAVVKCPNCQELVLPHQVCKNCGFYGKKEINIKKAVKVVKA
ncbi:MAG: 50S ribosomal protein L32 [Candidatus Daviesbacteria bacterium]